MTLKGKENYLYADYHPHLCPHVNNANSSSETENRIL